MRTLSARILLGFAALTVTIAAIAGNIIWNQHTLETWVGLVRQGYVPLALLSKNLEQRTEDLKSYVIDSFDKETNVAVASRSLTLNRQRRDRELTAIAKTLEAPELGALDTPKIVSARQSVAALQKLINDAAPNYDNLFAALARGEPLSSNVVASNLAVLRDTERRVWLQSSQLAKLLDSAASETVARLETNQHNIVRYMVLGGSAGVLFGIVITTWIVITLRPLRRLRDAARRVAAGDYGSRIDEKGPSEVRDLARELNSMAHAVEERERELVRSERLAAVGKMAAMITHEVRNPLSSIGLNTELLADEVESNEEARKLVRAIHHEVDRLTQITEEYLSFARLPKPKLAPEALNAIVSDLAAFVKGDLAAKQVKLEVDLTPSDPVALLDAAQIRQCLINLVRNASDAVTAKGGGTVWIRTGRTADVVTIEVQDDGTGITPDVLPRLFDPFFSTKDRGSGLGLALTQQIVKDHGGDLAVDSTPGKGTTFTLSVPANGPRSPIESAVADV